MSRFFLGCLAFGALALMIGQAIAESGLSSETEGIQYADNSNSGGVMIIETYSASSVPNSDAGGEMQPLPGNPGVEVAPDLVEEDVTISQATDGQ